MSWRRKTLDKLVDSSAKDRFQLAQINDLSKTSQFSFNGITKIARIESVLDGDTIKVVMIHDQRPCLFHVRLLGIDAPEMKPLKSNAFRQHIKTEALAARAVLSALLPKGSFCTLQCGNFCKFGRLLATVFTANNENANDLLVQQGFVLGDYDGSTKRSEWKDMWPQLENQRKAYALRENPVQTRESVATHNAIFQTKKCRFCCLPFF